MVPPCSDRITRAPPYLFARLVPHMSFRVRGYHPLWQIFPDHSTRSCAKPCQAFPLSLAATQGISVDFCSSGYLDVSVLRVCFDILMNSDIDDLVTQAGFPHSDIPGSKLVCQLPEAFRRLPRPSSPVAAKASIVCAWSLDHITPNDLAQNTKLSRLRSGLSTATNTIYP